MNIVSFNVRGCCSSLKRRRISQILQRGSANICRIQETKIIKMEAGIAYSLWRNNDMDWTTQNSSGRSGGIITMWNTTKITACSSFCGKGFLGLHIVWNNQSLIVINVYAPCG
ncbi:unnamed protein product [Lathyrus sativus]|nr:unnamed protein product [Lathyrus sativus]